MRDVTDRLQAWLAAGEAVALATVIDTWGSSPRKVGAKMGISASGDMVGSVSGGCVEAAVAEIAQRVLAGEPAQLVHFGVSDETAWEVGLACGGEIDVFVERLDADIHNFMHQALAAETPVARLVITDDKAPAAGSALAASGNQGETVFGDGSRLQHGAALAALRDGIRNGLPSRLEIPLEDGQTELRAFVDVMPPPERLLIVGGVHIAVALSAIAHHIGFRTIVIEPRRAFGTRQRFPEADRLIHEWPDQALQELSINTATAVAVLTHDPKIDDPALIQALPSPAFYVGALGSRRTQEKRRQRLLEAGVADADLSRLRGPIGLDIGAELPEEIALAIMAEVVQAKRAPA